MVGLIDTNVFLSVLAREEPGVHQDCVDVLGWVKSGKLSAVTTDLVLAEVAWVLGFTYKQSRTDIADQISSIVNLRGLNVVSGLYDYKQALEWFGTVKVKYVDCCIASMPDVRLKRWVVVSYDKDFDKLGVDRREPKKVLEMIL